MQHKFRNYALVILGIMLVVTMVVFICKPRPTAQWSETFAGGYANSMARTADDGYILCGTTWYPGNDYIWLIKTDVNGNKVWDNKFNREVYYYDCEYDWSFFSIQQTQDGGYIVCGTAYDERSESENVRLIKTDIEGNKIWDKTFGGEDSDRGISVQPTKDGGYIICGETRSYAINQQAAWLIKTDAEGNKTWDKVFGGDAWDESDSGNSVQQTADGGYVICGYTESYGNGSRAGWLIKTDADGNKLWDRTFGGEKNDICNSVRQTKDGGYIICGRTNSFSDNDRAWLIKTDADGNKLWDKTFGGMKYSCGNVVQELAKGGYLISGSIIPLQYSISKYLLHSLEYIYIYPIEPNKIYTWLIKTDSDGNRLWDKTFGGNKWNLHSSVQQATDGGYVVYGTTSAYEKIDDYTFKRPDILLIKIAPEQ